MASYGSAAPYYWLLVSVSVDHHQASIYKNFKNATAYIHKYQFCGFSFTFINSLCNYYQLLDVLFVVSCVEILLSFCFCKYCPVRPKLVANNNITINVI